MNLSVLARAQAVQYAASRDAEDSADTRKEVARTRQVKAIEAAKNDQVGAVDQKRTQEKKGFIGMVGGIAVGVAAVAAAVAIVAASTVTFGAAAVFIVGVAIAAAAMPAAGRAIGHDVWGKANAVKAAVLEKTAALQGLTQEKAADQAAEAKDSAEDSNAAALAAERFARQIRNQQQAMSESEEES